MEHQGFVKTWKTFDSLVHVFCVWLVKCLALVLTASAVACSSASSPDVSEIVPQNPPTIFGQNSINLTATSGTMALSGSCDPHTTMLQYSTNLGVTWVNTANCPSSGHYSITVPSPVTEIVWLRSKTSWGFTSHAIANIQTSSPTTTPILQMVSAGSTAPWTNPTNMTFTMPSTWTGKRTSAINIFNMDLHTTGSGFYAP